MKPPEEEETEEQKAARFERERIASEKLPKKPQNSSLKKKT